MQTIDQRVDPAAESRELLRAVRPDWRRQTHSWFLVGVAAANVAFDWLAARLIDAGPSSIETMIVGVLLGQLFLMGLWMALGGLRFAARFAAVAATTVVGAVVFWLGLSRDQSDLWDLPIYSGIIVLATHALLLPLRALVGWRIDFDPAYHARSADKTLQLRLSHLIAFTTACALPFALVRSVDDTEALRSILVFGGIGLAASAPVAWIVIGARRTWRFWLSACGMLFVTLLIDLVVVAEIFDSGLDDALFVYLGVVVTVLVNLGIAPSAFRSAVVFNSRPCPCDSGRAARRFARSKPGVDRRSLAAAA